MAKRSNLELLFETQLADPEVGLPSGWIAEFKFHPVRKWRFDFAHLELKILIDIQGGEWMIKSGHNTGAAYADDCNKKNVAQSMGYKVFTFTGTQVKNGQAIGFLDWYFREKQKV